MMSARYLLVSRQLLVVSNSQSRHLQTCHPFTLHQGTKLLEQIRASSKWSKSLLAKDVGTMNNVCQIRAGAPMTLDHMMAVKFYTDFTKLQQEFKRHCRRIRPDESVESVLERNSEIYHWCRR